MNTYSSVRSIDSQIQGRKMVSVEPNIAVATSQSRHIQNNKYLSPEPKQSLDFFTETKHATTAKLLKKPKMTQGQQGKPISQPKKPLELVATTQKKKVVKATVSPLKKTTTVKRKSATTEVKRKKKAESVKPTVAVKLSDQERRQQLGLGQLSEKQLKQLKKQKKRKDQMSQDQLHDKKTKDQKTTQAIKSFMVQKRKVDNSSKIQAQVVQMLENQRKKENLTKLDESVKEIFKKCKTTENSHPQTPKYDKKKGKESKKGENYQKLYEDFRNQIDDPFRKALEGNDRTMELKQKFQELSKRYQNVQTQHKQLPDELKHGIQEEDVEEQYSEEKSEERSVSGGQNYDESLNELALAMGQFYNAEYLEERINQILSQQEFIDPCQLSENEFQILQFHYLNQAATMVQKVWRGYYMRKLLLDQLQQMVDRDLQMEEDEEQFQNQHDEFENNNDNEDDNEEFDEDGVQFENDQQTVIERDPSTNQDMYFYNPFAVNGQQPAEKQIHYSTIKSSIVSEDDQKSLLQSSMIQHLQQELESWNCQIEGMVMGKQDLGNYKQVKQMMQQSILGIVSQHFKKHQKDSKCTERQLSDHSVEVKMRNESETNFEKTFNEARRKIHKQDRYDLGQDGRTSPKGSDINNRSSIMSLQSQLMKKENELLNMREEAINLRYNAEIKKIADDTLKRKDIDDWLAGELEDLRKTRQTIELSRRKEASALKKIQRDILIAQDYDFTPELQNLQNKVDEQFSQMKPNKLEPYHENIRGEEIEQIEETLSEDMQQEQGQGQEDRMMVMKQNVIESDKQIEIYQTVSIMTNDILDDLVSQFAAEIGNHKDQFEVMISNMIAATQAPQGIPLQIADIKQYISNFFSYILEHHTQTIINNLNIAYGFTPVKRMRLIHGYDDCDESETQEDSQHQQQQVQQDQLAFVLDESLFLEYEQYRLSQCDAANESAYAIKELEHIHNKAIFDACNEALNYVRPHFNNSGVPYPWEQFKRNERITEQDLGRILFQMNANVLNWSRTYCGFLPIEEDSSVAEEKQVIMDEKNQQMLIQQLHSVDNPLFFDPQLQQFDYLSQIRDERLYKMLITEIKESEHKWYNFSDDRTEYLMELSDGIFETLVEELAFEQTLQAKVAFA